MQAKRKYYIWTTFKHGGRIMAAIFATLELLKLTAMIIVNYATLSSESTHNYRS